MFRKGLTVLLMGSMLLFAMTVFADDDVVQPGEQNQYPAWDQERLREHQGDQAGDQARLREHQGDQTGDQNMLREHNRDMTGDRSMQRDVTHERMGAGNMGSGRMATGSMMGMGGGRGGSRR